MDSTRRIETLRQHLFEKARRSNVKSTRLQKKIQREMQKQTPNMNKVMKWQKRSVKYVNRGLRYMNKFDSLVKDNGEEKEIAFNMEKVCILFVDKTHKCRLLDGVNEIVIIGIFLFRSPKNM